MDMTNRSAGESFVIAEEVMATIACTATLEVPGVAGMAVRPGAELRGIAGAVANVVAGKRSAADALQSVRVVSNENVTAVDVYVNLKLGARIPDVVPRVQEGVKAALQSMTGKPVTKVNVFVADVVMEDAAT